MSDDGSAPNRQVGPPLRCLECGELKPTSAFAWRDKAKRKRQTRCRACKAAYHRQHYETNKQRYIDKAARSKRKAALARTAYLIEFFKTHPCVDCGERDPVVLEFDHLRDKAFVIGRELADKRWQDVLAEIEKCEVVCANCHRRRHRRNSLRAVLAEA
jgi:hypothetical protein